MKKANRVNSLFTVAIAVIVFLLSLTTGAQAVPIPVGIFYYEYFALPDQDQQLPGTATFTVYNASEMWAFPPDFPLATPITFIDSSIVLEYSNGAGNVTQSLSLGDITPGFSQGAFWSYEFADYTAFLRATFSATINQGSIQVMEINGLGETVYTLYNVTSSSIFTELLPLDPGTSLTPGMDMTVMYLDAEPATSEPVPEPSGLVLMGVAILMFIGWMRIRGEKRMTG